GAVAGLEQRQRFRSMASPQGLEAFVLEKFGGGVQGIRLVVDDENAGLFLAPLPRSTRANRARLPRSIAARKIELIDHQNVSLPFSNWLRAIHHTSPLARIFCLSQKIGKERIFQARRRPTQTSAGVRSTSLRRRPFASPELLARPQAVDPPRGNVLEDLCPSARPEASSPSGLVGVSEAEVQIGERAGGIRGGNVELLRLNVPAGRDADFRAEDRAPVRPHARLDADPGVPAADPILEEAGRTVDID